MNMQPAPCQRFSPVLDEECPTSSIVTSEQIISSSMFVHLFLLRTPCVGLVE